MSSTSFHDDPKPLASIEALVRRHGALTIGLAFLRAALARRERRRSGELWVSDHLRRDIGLGPSPHAGRDCFRYGSIE